MKRFHGRHARQVLTFAFALGMAGGLLPVPALGPPGADGWLTFEGSWSATGELQTLPTEGTRPASIMRLSGSVVLTGAAGLSRGFRGEAIGFDDGGSVRTGRSVWTDDHGDQIFAELRGEELQTGRHLVGTITGGTGRYAGATGHYECMWQYVVHIEDGTIQSRAVGLNGRIRRAEGAR